MANTFITYKAELSNSETIIMERVKKNILGVAATICQTLQTGWSIEESYINRETGKPDFKYERDFYIIDLIHISGSVMRFSIKNGANIYYGIFPDCSDIDYKKCWYDSTSSVQAAPFLIKINSYMPILAGNSLNLYISVDTSGKGICFYYVRSNKIQATIIGNYIHNFCYPANISSPCESSLLFSYRDDNITVKYFYQNRWKDGVYNNAKIIPILGFAVDESKKIILSPVMIGSSENKPYGYIDSACLNHINYNSFSFSLGNIIDNGNYICGIGSTEYFPTIYALGWSPLNTQEVNPWYVP